LALALPGGIIVRRDGWIGTAARFRACAGGVALVDRQRLGAGARRAGRIRLLAGCLGAAFGSFAVSLSVATLFVLIVAYFFPFSIANIIVAFSPGAQDTMMVLALALHLDPVFVAAHHVARFVVTAFSIAFAARSIAREEKR
jgi:hypothetical protein